MTEQYDTLMQELRPIITETINEGMRMGAYTIASGVIALLDAGATIDQLRANVNVILRDNADLVQDEWRENADRNAEAMKQDFREAHKRG